MNLIDFKNLTSPMNLKTDCDFLKLSPENPITGFDCGDCDLNDFFNNEALFFQRERLGQTFYYCLKGSKTVVGAFSLSADSVKTALLPGSRIKKIKELIPREKALQSYSALPYSRRIQQCSGVVVLSKKRVLVFVFNRTAGKRKHQKND